VGLLWSFLGLALSAADGTEEYSVAPDAQGRLGYRPDSFGNTVPDFSLAGYRHGGVALPVAPVVETLKPIPGSDDDSARIQTAIDQVAKLPERADDGIRGAVLLARGSWRCGTTLRLPPGVTLRGEGQDADGTVITATMKPRNAEDRPTLIRMEGPGSLAVDKTAHAVLDESVPLGAKRLKVEGASSFKPGDLVRIEHHPNQNWIHDLKMDQIDKLGAGDRQWSPQEYVLRWQARITAIGGGSVTLDTPMICAVEKRYGSAVVLKCSADPRGRGAAVERLRLVSEYLRGQETEDENHAWNAIAVSNVVDCWVNEVTALHFAYSCVTISKSAARITVQDCAMIDPVSKITGGRRYSFVGGGQYVLIQRCYTRNGRHDFVNGHCDAGPTVYLDCLAEKTHSDIGPHHRWGSGHLYDNVKGGRINVQDRGSMGTGHGWAGNCQVFWNCEAGSFICQKPWLANAQNWALGCVGKKSSRPDRPDGRWESLGKHLTPRSLYLTQLKERFDRHGGTGDEAIRLVTTPEQRQGAIWEGLRQRFAATN
jgi:hypothetical protein